MPFDLKDSLSALEVAQKLRQLPAEHAPPMPWAELKRRQLLRRARARAAQRRQFAHIAAVGLVLAGGLALRAHWAHAPLRSGPPIAQRLAPVDWDEAAARSVGAQRW